MAEHGDDGQSWESVKTRLRKRTPATSAVPRGSEVNPHSRFAVSPNLPVARGRQRGVTDAKGSAIAREADGGVRPV